MPLLQGCAGLPVGYFFQAVKGQFALFNHARPIPEVLKDERIRPRIRALLAQVGSMKKFGIENGLKPTPNYQDYVQLDRPAAVWVVSASKKLAFSPKVWGFPIVGSFPYIGWFDLDAARSFARGLKKEGWDVYVRGASAYSTLGWFRDSVLSSMIPDGKEALGELANVILHESTHATLYVNGQSYFDESLANFVADRLTPEYLRKTTGEHSPELATYLEAEKMGKVRERELHDAYVQLDQVYTSTTLTDAEKLDQKNKILADLKAKLKIKYDINNATLIQYKTYYTGQSDFEGLYEACGKDWRRFMQALSTLKSKSFSRPQQEDLAAVIKPLVDQGCRSGRPD